MNDRQAWFLAEVGCYLACLGYGYYTFVHEPRKNDSGVRRRGEKAGRRGRPVMVRRTAEQHAPTAPDGRPIVLDPATVIHPLDHPSLDGFTPSIWEDVALMPDPLKLDSVPDDVFDGLPTDPVLGGCTGVF